MKNCYLIQLVTIEKNVRSSTPSNYSKNKISVKKSFFILFHFISFIMCHTFHSHFTTSSIVTHSHFTVKIHTSSTELHPFFIFTDRASQSQIHQTSSSDLTINILNFTIPFPLSCKSNTSQNLLLVSSQHSGGI